MSAAPITYGSVCSGIEAASVAWAPLGWRAAWFSEIEPFPRAVLAHRYPETPNLGDMTTVAQRVRAGEVEAPDLFCGGTPCQSFSIAGKRESLADERGNLTLTFCETADAIDDVRYDDGREPSVVFWENVQGVLSTSDNAFGCFIGALAGSDCELQPAGGGRWTDAGVVLGPRRTVAWRILDAQYFGLAQRRRRVFVVASARAGFDPAAVLFEFDGVRRDTPPSREAGQGVAAGTLRSAGGGSDVDQGRAGHLRPVCRTLCVAKGQAGAEIGADMSPTLNCSHEAPYVAHTLRGEGFDASEDGTGRGTPLVPVGAARIAPHCVHGTQDPCVSEHTAFALGRNSGQENAVLAFDTTQITSPGNHSNPRYGAPCHPIAAHAHTPAIAFQTRGNNLHVGEISGTIRTACGQASGSAPCIAFSCKDHGADAGPVAPTLRAMGHGASHANAGGQVAVAFAASTAFLPQSSRVYGEAGIAPTLQAAGHRMGNRAPQVQTAMQVRRITPVEAERLQGFPDGWTSIPWRGRPADQCPDGPRYKAIGNSWAVPCVRWLGERIDREIRRTMLHHQEVAHVA